MMIESELSEKFKLFLHDNNFRIIREFINTSPDFIIEANRKKIAVEVKGSSNRRWFFEALGQLLFAKATHNVDELWLVLYTVPTALSREWFGVFQKYNIEILILFKSKLYRVTEDLLISKPWLISPLPKNKTSRKIKRKSCWEIDKNIFDLLKKHPEGLEIRQISKILGIGYETVQNHIKASGTLNEFSILKDKITVENDKISLK